MGIDLDARPCPFCGQRLRHIGSWAMSFEPPRLYHEWHHAPVGCYLDPDGRGKIMFSSSEKVEDQIHMIDLWNGRLNGAVGSSLEPKP